MWYLLLSYPHISDFRIFGFQILKCSIVNFKCQHEKYQFKKKTYEYGIWYLRSSHFATHNATATETHIFACGIIIIIYQKYYIEQIYCEYTVHVLNLYCLIFVCSSVRVIHALPSYVCVCVCAACRCKSDTNI